METFTQGRSLSKAEDFVPRPPVDEPGGSVARALRTNVRQ